MTNSSFLALVQNISLLLASVLAFELFIGQKKINQAWYWKTLFGFVLGGIGIALMLTPWVFDTGIIFDTRSVLLSISGLFFGSLATILAMIITGIFRYYQGGPAVVMGICVIIASGIIGILWRRIFHTQLTKISGIKLYLFGWLVHIVMLLLTFTLPVESAWQVLKAIVIPVLLIYPIGTQLLGIMLRNRLRHEFTIAELNRAEALMRNQVDILQHPVRSIREFLQLSMNSAVMITDSKIGHIFLYDEDLKLFTLNAVSEGVMDECGIKDYSITYQLDEVGLLGEAVRQRQAVTNNDYPSKIGLKKGYPVGHIKILRYLAVPVISGDKIVAVVGVANKPMNYTDADIIQLSLLMEGVWKSVERFQSDEARTESEQRYTAIVKNLPNGMIHIFDSDFHYLFNAGEGLENAGLTNEDLVGKTVFEVLGNPLGEMVAKQYKKVLAGQIVRFEGEFNGQTFLVNASPLRDKNDKIDRIMALSMDITDIKQTENSLIQAQNELQHSLAEVSQSRRALLSLTEDQKIVQEKIQTLNQELEQRVADRTAQLESTNQELEAFAYSVSHDLRAPLRAMDGFSGALLTDYQDKIDEQGKHYLVRIQEASQRMGLLIDDMLNLSRVTRHEMKFELVDLSVIAKRIVAEHLQTKSLNRSLNLDIAQNITVWADHNLMEMVMQNFIDNAFKFSSKQPLAVIQFGEIKKKGKRVLFVKDNGVGFDMTYSEKLFTPFQRLHSADEYPGTGIGLVIIKRIITRHGGKVWTESEVNKGATFFFTLEEKNGKKMKASS